LAIVEPPPKERGLEAQSIDPPPHIGDFLNAKWADNLDGFKQDTAWPMAVS
jgi:hypothetical protein